MRSTDDPDDDSQQSPDFVGARPRADRSAVARLNVADLDGEKESVKSSKSRQPMNRCQTCLKHENGKRAKDSTEADPQTARYKARSTKTAAFSRKTVHSNK